MLNIAPLADRLQGVKPSSSIAAKARVDALRAEGKSIVDFTIGEPDFPTPNHIIQGGIAALLAGHTRYTASAGTPELRRAIVGKLARENQLHYEPQEIVVGTGAKHIIFNALAATLNPGDEVVIPAPYWVSYPDMVAIHGGTPIIVPVDDAADFKLLPVQLEAALSAKTKWLVLNTPNNPTGVVYTVAELEALGKVLKKFPQVWIITDEIYEHFVYGSTRHVSILQAAPWLRDRTLIVNGLSKAYAFTGWRIGYGAGPVSLIKTITLLQTQSTTCASAVSQAAAVVALDSDQQCVRDAASLFESRRDRIVALLRAIPGIQCKVPAGAFYVFADVRSLIGKTTPAGAILANDVDVMRYFLESGAATVDGSSYGAPGYLRLSFATSLEAIDLGCKAIAAAVQKCQC